jgi:hypothetical protein
MSKLWITGKCVGDTWEFQGIFDSEARAVAEAGPKSWFVAPVTLNEALSDERYEFPGGFWPPDPSEPSASASDTPPE